MQILFKKGMVKHAGIDDKSFEFKIDYKSCLKYWLSQDVLFLCELYL